MKAKGTCVAGMTRRKLKNKGRYDVTKRKRKLGQRGSEGIGQARGLHGGPISVPAVIASVVGATPAATPAVAAAPFFGLVFFIVLLLLLSLLLLL